MKACSVSSHSVMDNKRFDACYHLSDGVAYRRTITHMPYPILSFTDVTSRIFYGVRANRIYVTNREHALPFLTGAAIMQSDLTKTKLVSRKYTPAVEEMTLKAGWVLVTRSGTIGQTAWSNKLYEGKYGSEDIIRLVPNGKMKGGVLYSYLASVYGQTLLTQGSFGAVIQHIEPSFISSLPIPDFPEAFQKEVDDLIQESAHFREEAANALNEALSIIEAEIGSSKVNSRFNCANISSYAISSKFHRFDSQFQIGKSQISKYSNSVKIGSVASKIFIGNRGKRNYVENGIPFLSSSDMMLANPQKSCKYISKNTSSLSDMIVNNRDILISRSGTVGNTIIVGENLAGVAISEHAMRLVIDSSKISPEYVFAYLMTEHGQDALQLLPYGSVIVTLGEDFLADVDLPILDSSLMEETSKHVSQYIEKRDKSIEKENLAISMVEQEMEKWN